MSGTMATSRASAGGLQASSSPVESASTVRGLYYLVMRCIPERRFFREEAEFALCRERLITQLAAINGALLDYCLTLSEIRLVVYLPSGMQPGRFVQELSGWLRSLNRRDGRGGHVLAERTRSQSIESGHVLRRIVCWLARYPVDQGLVTTPSAYRHSGYRAHVGLDPAAGLAVRLLLTHFGKGMADGRQQLRRVVRSFEISPDEYERLRRVDRQRRGTNNFSAQHHMSPLLGLTENEVRAQIAASVEREVCAKLHVPTTALFASPTPPGAALPRSVIVHVLTNAKVLRIATLARRYQRAPQTLRGEMQRHRSDPALTALFALDLEGLLGPDVWGRMVRGDVKAAEVSEG